MPLDNAEILVGVLVIVCLLLFYCTFNKNEGMHNNHIPGLYMKNAHDNSNKGLGYSAGFSRANKDQLVEGLNDMVFL
jgi:hypothetical protein